MKIISRTTSMKYKNTIKDIKTISKETGAAYIMEGSVRTHGNTLRITAQFVVAIQNIHLWADYYMGTLDDIFDIQEQVSSKIFEALRIHLTDDEKDTLQKRYTESTEAYQLYLQGHFFWNKRNEQGLNLPSLKSSPVPAGLKNQEDYYRNWSIHKIGENDHRSIAMIYTALGEIDQAFEWLEKSFERRESALSSLKHDPKLDNLRGDPRYHSLVKRMGLNP